MKSNILCFFIMVFFALPISAQKEPKTIKKDLRGMEKILSPKQLEMLKSQRELVRNQREVLKNSLTEEQKAVMQSRDLDPRERKKAFRELLNQNQRDMLETQKP